MKRLNSWPSSLLQAYISALFKNNISLRTISIVRILIILNVNIVTSATGKQVKCSWKLQANCKVKTGQKRFFSVLSSMGWGKGHCKEMKTFEWHIFCFCFCLDRFGLGQAGRIPGSVNAMRVLSTSTDLEAAVADALVRGPMCVGLFELLTYVFLCLHRSSLKIRSLSLLWYSLRLCKYWINLDYYSFLLKLLTLYISENWPFRGHVNVKIVFSALQ